MVTAKSVCTYSLISIAPLLLSGCGKERQLSWFGKKENQLLDDSALDWFHRWKRDSEPKFDLAFSAADDCLQSGEIAECGAAAAKTCSSTYEKYMCKYMKKLSTYDRTFDRQVDELLATYDGVIPRAVSTCNKLIQQDYIPTKYSDAWTDTSCKCRLRR